MFLITGFIPGEPLDKKLLIKADEEHRRRFYSQLIDILAELRNIEFSAIGSLMPNPDGGSYPIIGHIYSMSAATLKLPPQPVLKSAKDFMRYHFSLVSGFFFPPVRDYTIEDIQEEVFALHIMESLFPQIIDSKHDQGPFILHHPDLRGANIIVDNWNIMGIIDWEYISTTPISVCTPPSWITGHDLDKTNEKMHAEFRDVLYMKSKTDSMCNRLNIEWYGQANIGELQADMAFYIAHMLRCPTDIIDLFYDAFADELFGKSADDVVTDFFRRDNASMSRVLYQAEQCKRYTQHLKDHGLYETDLEKVFAESDELKKKFGWL